MSMYNGFMMHRKRGFTLIELLVVIGIIGILSSIVLVSVNSARMKARDAKRIQEVKQMMNALELFYSDNNHYPYPITDGSWMHSSQSTGDWPAAFKSDLSKYMPTIPKDPLNIYSGNWTTRYTYNYYSNRNSGSSYCPSGKCYFIIFQLEKGPNPYELTDGVKRCNGSYWEMLDVYPNYVSWGMSCK